MSDTIFLIVGIVLFNFLLHLASRRTAILRKNLTDSAQKILIRISFISITFCLVVAIAFKFSYSNIIYVMLVVVSCLYTYFHFFNMSLTARRVNILINIFDNATSTNKNVIYNTSSMVQNRIARLEALGQIKNDAGKLYMQKYTFYRVGKFLNFIGRFFVGKCRKD